MPFEVLATRQQLQAGLMKFSRWNPIPIEVGQRFGRLVVRSVVNTGGKRIVTSDCDCGRISKAAPSDIFFGKVVACGCYRIEQITGREPPADCFWRKVSKDTDGCWRWQATKVYGGYGRFNDGDKSWLAHRFSFVLAGGILEQGKELDHLCRTRLCVNPAHLEQVTRQVNIDRGLGAKKSHCIHGHPLSGPNLYVRPDGHRHCRACLLVAGKKWRLKRLKEAA